VLKKFGVEEIDCEGKEFDANTMQALMTDSDSNFEDDIVLDVLLKGYRLKDRVIRPASVKVNKIEK
jgi:molecular chaperone GrpE